MKTLVCIDRDGVLVYDSKDHLFLGRDDQWQSQVQLLPHVLEGLQKLRCLPDTGIYMITNQPGVAIQDYPRLTFERAHEVCRYVIELFEKMGGHLDGYFLCPHATPEYVSKNRQRLFDQHFVHPNCGCFKPRLGMVFRALSEMDVELTSVGVYVIGDRATDVQTALNSNGTGILIPFENQPGEVEKTRQLQPQDHVFIASNFLHAAQLIEGTLPLTSTQKADPKASGI